VSAKPGRGAADRGEYRQAAGSKRLGSPYRSGRSPHWVKVKNAPAVKREAEEDWGK
jgi:hypothetical protein